MFSIFENKLYRAIKRLEERVPPIGTLIKITSKEVGCGYSINDTTNIVGREFCFPLIESKYNKTKIAIIDKWYERI